MTSNARQIGLACLLGGHAALTFLLVYRAYPLTVGVVIGQAAVLSIWAALGPGRLTDRLPRTAFFLVVLWFVILWGYRARLWPLSLDASLYYLAGMIAEFAVLLILFGLARQFLGWRLDAKKTGEEQESLRETQFHVGRLLAWVGGIAVLLAMSRYLLPRIGPVRLSLEWEVLVLFGILNMFTAVSALPVVCVALRATRRWFAWTWILAVYCMIVSIAELYVLNLFNSAYDYGLMLALNLELAVVLAITLALLRSLGFASSPQAWPHPDRLLGGSPAAAVKNPTSGCLPDSSVSPPPNFRFLETTAHRETMGTETADGQTE
jgi:hypothetical protein